MEPVPFGARIKSPLVSVVVTVSPDSRTLPPVTEVVAEAVPVTVRLPEASVPVVPKFRAPNVTAPLESA